MSRPAITFHMSDGEQVRWNPGDYLTRDQLMESLKDTGTRFVAIPAQPNDLGQPKMRLLNVAHIVSIEV